MESTEILKIAANALNEKKAKELAAVKIDKLTVIAEYFLMCTATSSTHVRALADEVEEKLSEEGVKCPECGECAWSLGYPLGSTTGFVKF